MDPVHETGRRDHLHRRGMTFWTVMSCILEYLQVFKIVLDKIYFKGQNKHKRN